MDLNDLGLELLMNKKKVSSDAVSVISGSSGGGYRSQKHMVDADVFSADGDDEESDVPSVEQVNVEYVPPQRPQVQQHRVIRSESVSESDVSDYTEEEVADYPRRLSETEVLTAKQELLYQFDRLEKKGMRLPRKFTMASSLDEMKNEFARLKKDREIDNSVKFQRKVMMAVVSGIEFMNSKFDPFNIQLNGWSDSIHDNIDEYDDVFEELHNKYSGKAKIAPELKLLMMLGGSGFMFHMTNSMFKNFPGVGQVFKENPDLRKQFAAATASTMAKQNEGGAFGGLSSMFSGLFGGAPQTSEARPPSPPRPAGPVARPQMKGPSNMDEILRELEIPPLNNDRIEMMSTVTDSELGDDASLNGLLMNKKRVNKPRGSGLTLDI